MKSIYLTLLSVTLALSAHVKAEDGKNYNASACEAYSGDGKRLSYSNIYNTSSTTVLSADCVAIKDQINFSIKSAFIEVKDLSTVEDVSCTLISHYNIIGSSGGGVWSQNQKTTGFSSVWQKLSYTGLASATNGHYYFSCNVPKRTTNGASWLGTYQVTENS